MTTYKLFANNAITLLACLTFVSKLEAADGAKVIVTLKDFKQIRGELLIVRPTSIVVSKVLDQTDEDLTLHPEYIAPVTLNDIRAIQIEGESHVLSGMGSGLLWGGVVGSVLGLIIAPGPAEPFARPLIAAMFVAAYAAGGALAGMLIGLVIGAGSSVSSRNVDVNNLQDLWYFHSYARYQGPEPEYLKRF